MFINWQQDPFGNHVARLTFPDGVRIDALDDRPPDLGALGVLDPVEEHEGHLSAPR